MRTLWFISALGQGHVARCRPMIRALQARGHSCVVAVMGNRAAGLLEDLCPVLRPPPRPTSSRAVSTFRAPNRDAPAFVAIRDLNMTIAAHQPSVDEAIRAARFVAEAIERVSPDLVVVDQMVLAGPIAASSSIPVVQISSGAMLDPEGCWDPQLTDDPRVRCPAQLPRVNEALAAVGVGPVHRLGEMVGGDLLVVPTPRGFGSNSDALHVMIESELPHEDPLSVQTGSRPRAAIMMGGAPRLAEVTVRAALRLGLDALVFESHRLTLPPDLLEHRGVLPLPTVEVSKWLDGCSVAVHHGGAGSVVAAVLAGVPAIAIPTWTEQALNAHALQAAGAGIVVAPAVTQPEPLQLGPGIFTLGHRQPRDLGERLLAAIEDLLRAPFADAAIACREELLAMPKVDDVALAVEGFQEAAPRVSEAI